MPKWLQTPFSFFFFYVRVEYYGKKPREQQPTESQHKQGKQTRPAKGAKGDGQEKTQHNWRRKEAHLILRHEAQTFFRFGYTGSETLLFSFFFFLSYTKKYFVRYEISRESHRTSIHNINPMNGTGYRSIEMVCTLTDPNRNPSEPFFSKKKYEPLFFTNRYIDWGGV